MNKITTHIGLLLLRVGFSIGLMTHGYGKLLRVWERNFKFGDPIGIGSTPSLILAAFGEFIAPIFILIGWKTKLFSIFPAFTMLVAFLIAHDGDPFSKKEKSFLFLVAFIVIYLTGPGKYALDKQ
jgi:putative oxidoreductase